MTLLSIASIIQETSDTKSFILKADGDRVRYQPGQFLTLLHPLSSSIRRSYSLASHPLMDQDLQITVKRIPNGVFSRWFFDQAKVGDTMQTIGAAGFFTLPETLYTESKVLFLAAGSGITPILSLVKEVLFQRSQQIILIYSNHSESETIFYRALKDLERRFPLRLTIMFLFSNSKNLLRARASMSLLTELLEQHIPNKSNTLAYICGPLGYLQMAGITLLTENIPQENIHTEKFNIDKFVSKERPPDMAQHKVTIQYQRNSFSLLVKYPQTILQKAQRHGIDLPYSCEAGRCGTCAATCVSGKVWMSRNEVLLDKEMEKGRVLTCTGYPIGGDVELVVDG